MLLANGSRFGPYEIVAPLGAGGTGEVYRARDSRLNREIALKLLPELFAHDADRLACFTREAQVLASLNHPNIAIIHGLEESDGASALILELVEGPTLADRIDGGPIAITEALAIARQIADALEAAHSAGVVHRDLKPANVKLRADGTVKVLDFGLAKVAESVIGAGPQTGPEAMTNSPTLTSPAMMTGVGVILGTAAYMAPEQARGKSVDKRADIWAFGCVLYEMLTARRVFEGEDMTDTVAAVVRAEPAWRALPPETPAAIRLLLRRCLQKDPKDRLRDIGDARMEIQDAIAKPEIDALAKATVDLAPARRRRERLTWSAAGVPLIIALAFATISYVGRTPVDTQAIRFSVSTPEGSVLALGAQSTGGGPTAPLTISPDGRRLATRSRSRFRARSGRRRFFLASPFPLFPFSLTPPGRRWHRRR